MSPHHAHSPCRLLGRAVLGAGAAAVAGAAVARVLTGGPDADLALPGDCLLPGAPIVATHGLDIAAPAERIWPWLVQMGADRGGFYTFDRLERAVGLGIHNANAIHPQWQDLAVGDQVLLAAEAGFGLRVALLEANHVLVLSSQGVRAPQSAGATMDFDFTWAFVLLETVGGCRLLVRERYRPHAAVAWAVVAATLPVSRLMTRGLLAGVRRRVERDGRLERARGRALTSIGESVRE